MYKKLKIKGMHCGSCEILIQEDLDELGVIVKKISHEQGILNIEFDENNIHESQIKNIISLEGYKVVN